VQLTRSPTPPKTSSARARRPSARPPTTTSSLPRARPTRPRRPWRRASKTSRTPSS